MESNLLNAIASVDLEMDILKAQHLEIKRKNEELKKVKTQLQSLLPEAKEVAASGAEGLIEEQEKDLPL